MKLITKIYLGIGFILFIFSVVTISYLQQAANVEEDMKRVLISTEILRQSEAMQKSLVDMETGFRGYLISGKESFLEPYFAGIRNSQEQLKIQKAMVKNELRSELLNETERLRKHWVKDFASRVIEAKKLSVSKPETATQFDSIYRSIVISGQGKGIMDSTREVFNEFDAEETNNKNSQLAALERSLAYTRNISTGLTIMAIILGISIAIFLARTIHKRLSAMIDLAGHISQGDFDIQIDDNENDEMSRLSASLNIMATKLKTYFNNLTKTNKELDQFAYVVSHDLKAPLRAINNLAEWIAEDITDQDPEILQKLKLMRGRAQRMENLINGILEYSKIGRKEIRTATFNVKQLLEEIVDSLALPENFEIVLPDTAPTLTTQKILIQQVFTNLISNGIKYNNKPFGRIVVLARQTGNFYEFTVTDNGLGIPEQFRERVFGVFQTMEARDTSESTGIGLAIVKKIIDEKGGSIRIESVENEFTSFIFTWPVMEQKGNLVVSAPLNSPVYE